MKIQRQLLYAKSIAFLLMIIPLLLVTEGIWVSAISAEEDFFETLQLNQFKERVEAPDFSLPLIGGGEAKLSDYKGNVIFLNFWTTW